MGDILAAKIRAPTYEGLAARGWLQVKLPCENTYIGRSVGGEPAINEEAAGVRLIHGSELDR
ncbi:hypothetical protein [Streptomyces anulatus]|uniref:hypothetical protein n=1 Tax=Streptomyces anulatus TaxID=1892 RepID=UPI003870436B|nr:hypothetical protein OG238_06655 [Streptomyces anulatus]